MPAIDNIIRINITQASPAVTAASTKVPLILGKTDAGWPSGDNVHLYGSAASMLTDGFKNTDPEYIYAVAMTSQQLVPATFMVGRRVGSDIPASIQTVVAQNNGWYCLLTPGASDAEILTAAAAIEPLKKIYIPVTATADVASPTSTSDVAAKLKASNYNRTGLMFSPNSALSGIEAAWVGANITYTPGQNTWAFKTLAGPVSDTLSDAQQIAAIGVPVAQVFGKNVNVYQNVAGYDVTEMGTMASGRYIDQTVGVDELNFQLQADLMAVLVDNAKVPETDAGVGVFISVVRACLMRSANAGFLDAAQGITVTAPAIASLPKSTRQARIAAPISFVAYMQGAVHAVQISGVVDV